MKTLITSLLITAASLTASNLSATGITAVTAENAPKIMGPFSQAVRAGQFLFISGNIAIDPAKGELVGDNVVEQTHQVITNIEAVLHSQGLTLENVVKAEVYLKHMHDYKKMNEVYAERFSHAVKPARQAMEVGKLPLKALVEISCIAYFPEVTTCN